MPHREDQQQWAIVGGGMIGLSIALRLARHDAKVTLYEAAPELGGLTASHSAHGVKWDRYYHVIEARDHQLLALLDEIELSAEIAWTRTKTNYFDGHTVYPLNDVFDYLRLPALGVVDKLRVAATIARGMRVSDLRPLESLPASTWLIHWSGANAYENLWCPLLRAKLGNNYERVSAAYICAVIKRFYGARQGRKKTELFGYVKGGYDTVINTLMRRLRTESVEFKLGEPVTAVRRNQAGLEVCAGENVNRYDRVIVTAASPLAARVCHDLSAQEKSEHARISYQGVVCASLLLRAELGGAYLTYITDPHVPFTAIIEMSSLVDRSLLDNHHLVYLPKYVTAEDPFYDCDDETVKASCITGLQRIFPKFDVNDIVCFKVARSRHVMSLPELDYSQRLPSIKTSVPGLYICNAAQIVNASLSVTEAVGLATKTVDALLRSSD